MSKHPYKASLRRYLKITLFHLGLKTPACTLDMTELSQIETLYLFYKSNFIATLGPNLELNFV